jgi:flagellar protein FlaJ
VPRIDNKLKKTTWVFSVALAGALISYGFLMFWPTAKFDEIVFFAVTLSILPSAMLNYIDYKWRKAVDEHLPDLFRSIVQAQDTGMTLPQAIEEESKRNYGPLSCEESLLSLGKRVNTMLVQRTIPMIIEASTSGGRIEKVFDPLGRFIKTTLLLDKERRAQTRPYIAIIYVAFFVFLFTIILLFRSFFVNGQGLSMLANAVMSPSEIERIFFHMTSVQAFFSGLVAGKMGDGEIRAGLKHSLILMLCGYIALRFFL